MITVALCAQRPPTRRQPFLGNLVLADLKAHGYPYKASESCVDKGDTGGRTELMCPLQAAKRGFPGGSEVKASACNAGDLGSIPGLGSCPGEGNGNPLQYSCLENPKDGGAWWASVHFHFASSQGTGKENVLEAREQWGPLSH